MARIVLSHDWLLRSRGAERVLAEFCQGLEPSRIHTLFADPQDPAVWLSRHSVLASRLNRLPVPGNYYRFLLPLFPGAVDDLFVDDADLLLSVSHSVAKSIPHEGSIPHVCYCLTPMRYLWIPDVYGPQLSRSPSGLLLQLISQRLKSWDLETSKGVDHFVAISRTVQERIERVYGRSSDLIYPGVDLEFYRPAPVQRDAFYLVVSALVPQKRIDLAVEAFSRGQRRLVVVGEGPLRNRLEQKSSSGIDYRGWLPDEEIRRLYQTAKALVFPGLEDFGMVPVEAQACGCPVIALGRGGATETVVEGETGLFFQQDDADSLNQALGEFERSRLDPAKAVKNASRFSLERFRSAWSGYLERLGWPGAFPNWT